MIQKDFLFQQSVGVPLATSFSGGRAERAEWKSTMLNRSKRNWPEAPLNFVEIKNPFESFQTNPLANAWWVVLFIFSKKCFSETP